MPKIPSSVRRCPVCGKRLKRRIYKGRIEDKAAYKNRVYCSDRCAEIAKHPDRWETYHLRARKHKVNACEACGYTEKLHAHHIDGDYKNSDPDNIQTLCVWCHNFIHATAKRLGWPQPGAMPSLYDIDDDDGDDQENDDQGTDGDL